MSEFRNRVLTALDNVYGFLTEKRSVSSLQLEQPIQLVHDVSREAELGGGVGEQGGFFIIQENFAFAGAAVDRNAYDVHALIEAEFGVRDRSAYLLDFSGEIGGNTAQFTFLSAAHYPPVASYPGNDYSSPQLVAYHESVVLVCDTTGAGSDTVTFPDPANIVAGYSRFPVYLAPGAILTVYVSAGGAGGATNVRTTFLLWVGPKGVYPPGWA